MCARGSAGAWFPGQARRAGAAAEETGPSSLPAVEQLPEHTVAQADGSHQRPHLQLCGRTERVRQPAACARGWLLPCYYTLTCVLRRGRRPSPAGAAIQSGFSVLPGREHLWIPGESQSLPGGEENPAGSWPLQDWVGDP